MVISIKVPGRATAGTDFAGYFHCSSGCVAVSPKRSFLELAGRHWRYAMRALRCTQAPPLDGNKARSSLGKQPLLIAWRCYCRWRRPRVRHGRGNRLL